MATTKLTKPNWMSDQQWQKARKHALKEGVVTEHVGERGNRSQVVVFEGTMIECWNHPKYNAMTNNACLKVVAIADGTYEKKGGE